MKKALLFLALTANLTTFAKTELICARDKDVNFKVRASVSTDDINNRVRSLEAEGKEVEITNVSVARTSTPENAYSKESSSEVICVVIKY